MKNVIKKVVSKMKKEVKAEPVQKSGFDPSIPENKQREYR